MKIATWDIRFVTIMWETIENLQEKHPRYHYGWDGFVPMVWWI